MSSLEIWNEGDDAWETYTTAGTAFWPWIKEDGGPTSSGVADVFGIHNDARIVSVDTIDITAWNAGT